jgi:hypothetical protein
MGRVMALLLLFLAFVFMIAIIYQPPQVAPPQRGVSYFDYCTTSKHLGAFDKCLFGDHQQEI